MPDALAIMVYSCHATYIVRQLLPIKLLHVLSITRMKPLPGVLRLN